MNIAIEPFSKNLFSLIENKKKLLMGISGGMDSLVLLDLCLKILPKNRLYAIHVNHGLSNESKNYEQFVQGVCSSNKIPLIIRSEKRTKKNNESVEMWARRIRYSHFHQALNDINYDYILTAHHANDNCETMLMNLDSGCSINGLKGIPEKNGKVIRPLIKYNKTDIENYANLNNIKYVTDISNNDLTIKRNYVRKTIINKLEAIDSDVIDKFSLISNKAKLSVMRLNYVIKSLAKSIEKNSLGHFLLEDEKLKNFSDFHKLTLIKELIGETSKPWRSYKFNSLTNFFHNSKTGSILILSNNWTILRDRKKWILRQNKSIKVNININNHGKYNINDFTFSLKKTDRHNFNNNLNTEVIDYDKIKNKNLRIRSWLNGDWFQPLGMNGKKKISDYLIDNKIDCFKKENQLVLTADDDIIWLCGQRISDKVKVTNSTSNMMELSYNKFAQ
tara:strand:+ start:249 stop:1589 length:1341 start_codon:yes stop_codon:yes gene_type:complete